MRAECVVCGLEALVGSYCEMHRNNLWNKSHFVAFEIALKREEVRRGKKFSQREAWRIDRLPEGQE